MDALGHMEMSIQKEKVIKKLKDEKKYDSAGHISEADLDMEQSELNIESSNNGDEVDATWGEVCHACCDRTPKEWSYFAMGCIMALLCLYIFLFGLDLLATGSKVMGGCTAGALFGDNLNAVGGVVVGVMATVLFQSSSATASIVVSLVGADIVSVRLGIYIIMGTNVGTSVTNTIVALGHMGDEEELERAFAGATVHDMFNFLSLAILLPIEVATGFLFHFSEYLIKDFKSQNGTEWEGPVKRLVSPLVNGIIISNQDVATDIARGVANCSTFYPNNGTLACEDYNDPLSCNPGLMKCDMDAEEPYCPAFFDPNGTESEDRTAGLSAFLIGLVIIFISLFALIKILHYMFRGASTRVLHKATSINGYVSILFGAGLTMLVQSSSITTALLTPLVGVGALPLEQMLPLTLGANLGTTFTAILAALFSKPVAMQVALAHLIFNVVGILIWYPIPRLRRIPLTMAERLGQITRIWRGFPFVYILVTFFLLPLIIFAISSLFTTGNRAMTAVGGVVVFLLLLVLLYFIYWFTTREGGKKLKAILIKRQRRKADLNEIDEEVALLKAEVRREMAFLKSEIRRLSEHTGYEFVEEFVEEELVEEQQQQPQQPQQYHQLYQHHQQYEQHHQPQQQQEEEEQLDSGLTSAKILELRQTFHKFDPDGDGHIDTDELKVTLKRVGYNVSDEGIDNLLKQIDVNGDKRLDFEEFIAWFRLLWKEEMKEKFKAIDVKNRGYIDKEQLKAYLVELGQTPSDEEMDELCYEMDPEGTDKILLDSFITQMASSGAANSYFVINGERYVEKLKEDFRAMDVDNSGSITKHELQEQARKHDLWLSEIELAEAMKEMDDDGDGEITLDEYIAAHVRIRDLAVKIPSSKTIDA